MVTCIDLDLFYGKVKFCFIGFLWEKVTMMNILKIISAWTWMLIDIVNIMIKYHIFSYIISYDINQPLN